MRKGHWVILILATLLAAAHAAQATERMVSRGAYILQAETSGAGPAAVVFESGFGQDARSWSAVIAGLGERCRCTAYDRAGLGKSGTDGKPKRIEEHLADLGAVIDEVAPGQSVILVGHSYGGLLVTEFARRHPDRVAGLVLVDPTTWGQRQAFRQADPARVAADDQALLSILPPTMVADYRVLMAQLDAPEAAVPRQMPDVPVALLTSTRIAAEPFVLEETAAGKALWKAQHAALFAGFWRGTHRYLATGHRIQEEDPAAVVSEILAIAGNAWVTSE